MVAYRGHDQLIDDGSARLQIASEAQHRLNTADRRLDIPSLHGSPHLEGRDTSDLSRHLDVGVKCCDAQTSFKHAPIDALRSGKLAKTLVVQLDHLVDRRCGKGFRVPCERLCECKMTPGPFGGGLPPSFGIGARGKAHCHFLPKLEQ